MRKITVGEYEIVKCPCGLVIGDITGDENITPVNVGYSVCQKCK